MIKSVRDLTQAIKMNELFSPAGLASQVLLLMKTSHVVLPAEETMLCK